MATSPSKNNYSISVVEMPISGRGGELGRNFRSLFSWCNQLFLPTLPIPSPKIPAGQAAVCSVLLAAVTSLCLLWPPLLYPLLASLCFQGTAWQERTSKTV